MIEITDNTNYPNTEPPDPSNWGVFPQQETYISSQNLGDLINEVLSLTEDKNEYSILNNFALALLDCLVSDETDFVELEKFIFKLKGGDL